MHKKPKRALICGIACAVAAIVSGCGSASDQPTQTQVRTVTVTTTTTAAAARIFLPAAAGGSTCDVQLQGHDASVTYSSKSREVEPLCGQFVQSSASGGELWITKATLAWSQTPSLVCDVHQGSVTAEVFDTGGQIFGEQACTELIAAGWAERGQ